MVEYMWLGLLYTVIGTIGLFGRVASLKMAGKAQAGNEDERVYHISSPPLPDC